MSNRDLSIALRLQADSARFVAGLTQAGGGVRKFTQGARNELESLKRAMGSLQGQLASLGVSVGAISIAAQSARMDKSLTQIGQTAGVSRGEVEKLRGELFRMAGETGQSVDDLQAGFNTAVQSGLRLKEALPVTDAVNKAMAVTGANATQLTAALGVAATAFDFDLAKPNEAALLLDKMTVAGRLGNAELADLSSIFGRIGVNASAAGMGFDKTLAFIEALSMTERQPERLATLADSTLRLFTNQTYMKNAQKVTGVRFYDAKGERREADAVLKDIKSKYDKLKTTEAKEGFIGAAFGQTDQDTIKGLRKLLDGNDLTKIAESVKSITGAGGTVARDLPMAINNAVDATGQLKARLREAADGFARPINELYTNIVRWGLDKKENGGLGLDGQDMIVGGTALAIGTIATARYGGKALNGLIGKMGGTAVGIAEGKAIEAAAGVTPVFVVNMPGSFGGGVADGLASKLPTVAGGATTIGGSASVPVLAAAAPLAVMYGVSEWADNTAQPGEAEKVVDRIQNSPLSKALQFLGLNKDAEIADRLARNRAELDGNNELKASININVNQEGRVTSVVTQSDNSRVPLNVDTGRTMAMP